MRARLFVLLVGTVVFASCDSLQDDVGLFCAKKIEQGDDPSFGEMSALRNGEPWIVFPRTSALGAFTRYDGEATMSIFLTVTDVRYEHPFPWPGIIESLHFEDIPQRLGTYPLPLPGVSEPQGHYFYAHVHGNDVSGLGYYLDISEETFISIDAYDPFKCTIQGTFALTVVNTQPKDMYPYVDTLRFTEGRFHTHVIIWPSDN
ncbi:MAG: hypothetical protein F4221_10055 [Rhodothermaceae bacterium]|nr:hypothetical protein [Rhodothermaceae bacterium]